MFPRSFFDLVGVSIVYNHKQEDVAFFRPTSSKHSSVKQSTGMDVGRTDAREGKLGRHEER